MLLAFVLLIANPILASLNSLLILNSLIKELPISHYDMPQNEICFFFFTFLQSNFFYTTFQICDGIVAMFLSCSDKSYGLNNYHIGWHKNWSRVPCPHIFNNCNTVDVSHCLDNNSNHFSMHDDIHRHSYLTASYQSYANVYLEPNSHFLHNYMLFIIGLMLRTSSTT